MKVGFEFLEYIAEFIRWFHEFAVTTNLRVFLTELKQITVPTLLGIFFQTEFYLTNQTTRSRFSRLVQFSTNVFIKKGTISGMFCSVSQKSAALYMMKCPFHI